MKYSAHGLLLESELDLNPLRSFETDKNAQAFIKYREVSASGLVSPKLTRPFAHADENIVWMDIPNIARYQIFDGNTIHVDPYPMADEQSVRLYLMGSALGALLHQRGNLVLHANAIKVDDGLIVFAGKSGAGKSTTAAVFHQRGYEVISDDVLAINEQCLALGGFPQIKLWQDTLRKLDIDSQDLNRIRTEVNKYSFPIPSNYTERRLPIHAIYILHSANEQKKSTFEFSTLKGIEKFNMLKHYTYRKNMVEGMGLKPNHLRQCAMLARETPISSIIRPTSYFNAPELADTVIEDLKELGISTKPTSI